MQEARLPAISATVAEGRRIEFRFRLVIELETKAQEHTVDGHSAYDGKPPSDLIDCLSPVATAIILNARS